MKLGSIGIFKFEILENIQDAKKSHKNWVIQIVRGLTINYSNKIKRYDIFF